MKNSCSIIFVLFCLLAGCVSKTVPPASIYTISPEWDSSRAQEETEKKNSTIIKMALVRGTRALTGTEILYTDAQYGRNSYAYSRWSDAPVRLLQILFHVALEKSGRFGAVVPPTSASEADLLLESTLYDFSHHIKEFVSCVQASSQNDQGAATALNKAATNVARDLVSWLAEPGRL